MGKRTVGFRLSEAARKRLAELSSSLGVTRTAVIEGLLLHETEGGSPARAEFLRAKRPPRVDASPSPAAATKSETVKQKMARVDTRVAEERTLRRTVAPGRPDPEKIQAAQDRLLKPRKK